MIKKLNFRRVPKRFALLGSIVLLALGALLPVTAFAASAQQPTKCGADDVKCVISAGDALITKRLTDLKTLSSKIATDLSSHKITSDQASALQSDVSSNQSGLTTLKTQLDAETVAKNARQDAATIFTQYRIYAVVLPRDYRHLEMDIEINAEAVMQKAAPAIKTAIGAAPADKQKKLNSLYSDYEKQIADAQSQITSAQNDFPALTVANFNQNHTSYEATRLALDNALKAARLDLHKAAGDIKDMTKILGIKA
ncbi:MAG TPA: hypothetical protein VGD98_05755 [Ktedonobacteraceae bacterium]